MKNIYLLLLLLVSAMANSQVVNIPDLEFKQFLVNIPSINTNGDNEIQVSEALLVTSLWINTTGITNLTGIKEFANLEGLSINGQSIANLDLSGMTHLNFINCEDNQIQTINLTGLTALSEFYCANNLLTSLNISGLNSLTQINCESNQLTSLELNLQNLIHLACSGNMLTSLSLGNLTSLEVLSCGNNQLSVIDISSLVDLALFSCDGNLITTLDLSNNLKMCMFSCNSNPNLISVNMKNGSQVCGEQNDLSENPNLKYVCTDEAEVLDLVNYFALNGMMNVNVNTYCSFEPGGSYNTISGNIKFDADNNGCDANDVVFSNVKVNLSDGTDSFATFTNQGDYKFYTLAGNYSVSAAIENPTFFTINPSTANFTFPLANNTISQQNFCITPNGTHQDLEIIIAPIIPARPGFEAVYKIVYRNKGNTIMSMDYGVAFFYNQNLMSFVSADVAPNTVGPGGLSWNYSNLKPFESRSILVTMQINPPTDLVNPVNIGDVLVFNSTISPIGTDESQTDNYGVFNQTVVGSFDPNDIECVEGNVVNPTEIGKYLHYVIRFENTGTAAAENIVVKTEINPADFDINSLQLLNASHLVDTRIHGTVAEFIFKNILLDSGGHGNILLKIKSKANLVVGDAVNKMANIFFDYNFPVATNQAETVFENLSIGDAKDISVTLYPNPVSDQLNIKTASLIKSVQVYDVQGRILMSSQVGRNQTELNISNYPDGIYFVKISTEKGTSTQKVIKK